MLKKQGFMQVFEARKELESLVSLFERRVSLDLVQPRYPDRVRSCRLSSKNIELVLESPLSDHFYSQGLFVTPKSAVITRDGECIHGTERTSLFDLTPVCHNGRFGRCGLGQARRRISR